MTSGPIRNPIPLIPEVSLSEQMKKNLRGNQMIQSRFKRRNNSVCFNDFLNILQTIHITVVWWPFSTKPELVSWFALFVYDFLWFPTCLNPSTYIAVRQLIQSLFYLHFVLQTVVSRLYISSHILSPRHWSITKIERVQPFQDSLPPSFIPSLLICATMQPPA